MAAPNIISATSIIGKTALAAVTVAGVVIVYNSSNSGKVYKLNALYVSNIDGTDNAEITVTVTSGASERHIAKTLMVPANATVDVLSKPVYLEENMGLKVYAGVDGDLEAVTSYEEIS